jgi:hypothetical protein
LFQFAFYKKKLDWAENFILKYKELIDSFANDYYLFNLARIYYEKKDYKNAKKCLIHVDFEEVLTVLNGKAFLAKILFETKDYNYLESHLAAFESYLKRKNNLEYLWEMYDNFIKTLKKICFTKFTKLSLNTLLEDIKDKKIAEKQWLIEQLNDLKN